MKVINVGDVIYWARIRHETGIYEVCELYVRTVYPESFVGVDKRSKQAYIIGYDECGISVFDDRETVLSVVKEAEKRKQTFEIDTGEE